MGAVRRLAVVPECGMCATTTGTDIPLSPTSRKQYKVRHRCLTKTGPEVVERGRLCCPITWARMAMYSMADPPAVVKRTRGLWW